MLYHIVIYIFFSYRLWICCFHQSDELDVCDGIFLHGSHMLQNQGVFQRKLRPVRGIAQKQIVAEGQDVVEIPHLRIGQRYLVTTPL